MICRLAADSALSTTTKTNLSGMAFVLQPNKNYSFEFYLHNTANAATVGVQFSLTFTGTVTSWRTTLEHPASTSAKGWITASGASPHALNPLVSQGNVAGISQIYGTIEVGATGGTLQLQHASETATLTTVLRGSHGICVENP
jgi:hypothetical protein